MSKNLTNNLAKREASQYKKAIKLNSQSFAGVFSFSHAPAMMIPLLIGTCLLLIGVPMLPAVIITLWIFTTFLFAIRDKPEAFIRRLLGSRRKHWKRKLSRSKSLFNQR